MAKCKWCHESGPVNQYGYCDSCNDEIRRSIIANKTRLEELSQSASPGLSDEEKKKIIDEVLKCREILWGYKNKGVSFFKSDVDAMCEAVYAKMGIPFQFQRKPQSNQPTSIIKKLLVLVGVILFFAVYIDGQNKADEIESLNFQLDLANQIVEVQNTQIDELQAMIEEMKEPSAPVRRSFSLSNGNYVSGKDFTPGTYDIKAISGGGNVYSDNAYSGGINAIMGAEGDASFYQREYKNISLPEGTTLTITDVKVRLTLVE